MERVREQLRKLDDDPIGDVASSEISMKQLDRLLTEGNAEAAGLVLGTMEELVLFELVADVLEVELLVKGH